jgi:hypothetical protein
MARINGNGVASLKALKMWRSSAGMAKARIGISVSIMAKWRRNNGGVMAYQRINQKAKAAANQ